MQVHAYPRTTDNNPLRFINMPVTEHDLAQGSAPGAMLVAAALDSSLPACRPFAAAGGPALDLTAPWTSLSTPPTASAAHQPSQEHPEAPEQRTRGNVQPPATVPPITLTSWQGPALEQARPDQLMGHTAGGTRLPSDQSTEVQTGAGLQATLAAAAPACAVSQAISLTRFSSDASSQTVVPSLPGSKLEGTGSPATWALPGPRELHRIQDAAIPAAQACGPGDVDGNVAHAHQAPTGSGRASYSHCSRQTLTAEAPEPCTLAPGNHLLGPKTGSMASSPTAQGSAAVAVRDTARQEACMHAVASLVRLPGRSAKARAKAAAAPANGEWQVGPGLHASALACLAHRAVSLPCF